MGYCPFMYRAIYGPITTGLLSKFKLCSTPLYIVLPLLIHHKEGAIDRATNPQNTGNLAQVIFNIRRKHMRKYRYKEYGIY